MYTGIVPQYDFFIYVPLLRKEEGSAKLRADSEATFEERNLSEMEEKMRPALTRWTRVALPGPLTVYTHICGDEER